MPLHADAKAESIEREKEIEVHDVTYIEHGHDESLLQWSTFILESRFNYDTNLKLAYLLIHAQSLNCSEAQRILKISSRILYQTILPENPCFLSQLRKREGWGNGGKERRIILSNKAKEYLNLIDAITERHLGKNECQRLREFGSKFRRESLRKELKGEKMRKDIIEKSKRLYKRGRMTPLMEKTNARLAGLTVDEFREACK